MRSWTPAGYYVVVAQDVSGEYWYVRVMNFATFVHRRFTFSTETDARAYAALWYI